MWEGQEGNIKLDTVRKVASVVTPTILGAHFLELIIEISGLKECPYIAVVSFHKKLKYKHEETHKEKEKMGHTW
jgi:hypothetical protein